MTERQQRREALKGESLKENYREKVSQKGKLWIGGDVEKHLECSANRLALDICTTGVNIGLSRLQELVGEEALSKAVPVIAAAKVGS